MSHYWAAQFRSDNHLDGYCEHLCAWPPDEGRLGPKLFRTRQECRDWIAEHYSYIRRRPDLQCEPHGWTPVRVVKVQVDYQIEVP